LNVLDQVRLGGVRGQGGQTNDQRHGCRAGPKGTVPLRGGGCFL
jgi:hypothetical protein